MELTQIHIYPVKSLGGISLQSGNVLEKGMEDDRRWMIVDDQNLCVTQREIPKMTLVQLESTDLGLKFSMNGSSIELEKSREGGPIGVDVWSDHVKAVETDDRVGEWLSDHLGQSCRLVKMVESENVRQKLERTVSFADGYPYLILGNSSMNDLNQRLDEDMSILRFRPNLVFSGGDPYEEDLWESFTVGEVDFYGVKPCARCVMTTIDPKTAEKAAEPLKTLSEYRRVDNNVLFGLNAFPETLGQVKVGDPITIKTKRN